MSVHTPLRVAVHRSQFARVFPRRGHGVRGYLTGPDKWEPMELSTFARQTILTLPITPKTKSNYLGALRRYVEPHIGTCALTEITRSELRTLLSPLPPPTQYQTLMMLKTVFREAVELGLIEHAPTDRLRAERVPDTPKRFLRWEEMQEIDFGKYDSQIRFMALHGPRWGEAVVLEESDIRDNRVVIWRSVHGTTKSAAGIRTVPYVGYFKPLPKDRRSLAKALAPYGVTIHSLRRTYAYLLKKSGVHVTTAQKLLGHASPHLTLAVYTQVLDDEIDIAGQLIRNLAAV